MEQSQCLKTLVVQCEKSHELALRAVEHARKAQNQSDELFKEVEAYHSLQCRVSELLGTYAGLSEEEQQAFVQDPEYAYGVIESMVLQVYRNEGMGSFDE